MNIRPSPEHILHGHQFHTVHAMARRDEASPNDNGQQPSCVAWDSLFEGELVEILYSGKITGVGNVDAFMSDGSTVWIWMNGGHGRVMLLSDDGYCLRRPPMGGSTAAS